MSFNGVICVRIVTHCTHNTQFTQKTDLAQHTNLLLEGVRLGLSQKELPEDSSKTYSLG